MKFHVLEERLIARDHRKTLDLLRRCQKFHVGDADAVPNIDLEEGTFPRLPFGECAFEFILETETRWVLLENVPGPPRGLLVFVFGLENHRFVLYGAGGLDTTGPATLVLTHFDQCGGSVTKEDAYELTSATLYVVGEFLSVLNCSNVVIQENEPPVALNKKRGKRGKVPLYSYKTLVLKPTAARRLIGLGTHESPRIHLRRGHIKHRKTGDFWWQPCVVGDRTRGVVMKDYKADQLVSERQK